MAAISARVTILRVGAGRGRAGERHATGVSATVGQPSRQPLSGRGFEALANLSRRLLLVLWTTPESSRRGSEQESRRFLAVAW